MTIITMKEGITLIFNELTDKMVVNLGLEEIEGESYEQKRDRILKHHAITDKLPESMAYKNGENK